MSNKQRLTLDACGDVLTVEEWANITGLSTWAVYEAVKRGEVPGVIRMGRRILLSKSALLRLLTA